MARLTLPDVPGLQDVVAALGGELRLVGGVVRDTLAGLAIKDVDVATPLSPQTVIAKLEAAGLKAVPTGIAHGTVTAVAEGKPFEITTLRRDVATDGRHATVAYTDDWREDAARRDFTINALYADPASGEIFDYFGGVDDLAAGLVRFIGDPLQRIAEDHLRILRFFRFSARFAKDALDTASLDACRIRANDLMALSRERIAMEILALLALPNPAPTIARMIDAGIFTPVLPEIDQADTLANLVAREREENIAADPIRRLCALLPANPAVAEDVANRLKLSNVQRKRMTTVADRSDADGQDPRALAYWLGYEAAIDRLLLGGASTQKLTNWTAPRFPLTGGAIVARGIQAGPDVARILQTAERQWVAEGFPDAARAAAIIDQLVAS